MSHWTWPMDGFAQAGTQLALTANSGNEGVELLTKRPQTTGQKLAAVAKDFFRRSSSNVEGKARTLDTAPMGQQEMGATGTSCLPIAFGLALGAGVMKPSSIAMLNADRRE